VTVVKPFEILQETSVKRNGKKRNTLFVRKELTNAAEMTLFDWQVAPCEFVALYIHVFAEFRGKNSENLRYIH